jgi:hypothetical protein
VQSVGFLSGMMFQSHSYKQLTAYRRSENECRYNSCTFIPLYSGTCAYTRAKR